jgi:hypothetical protein
VINKISSLLEYQGTLQFADGLSFLQRLSWIILQAWNSSSYLVIPLIITHLHIHSLLSTSLCWLGVKLKNQKKNCLSVVWQNTLFQLPVMAKNNCWASALESQHCNVINLST